MKEVNIELGNEKYKVHFEPNGDSEVHLKYIVCIRGSGLAALSSDRDEVSRKVIAVRGMWQNV